MRCTIHNIVLYEKKSRYIFDPERKVMEYILDFSLLVYKFNYTPNLHIKLSISIEDVRDGLK